MSGKLRIIFLFIVTICIVLLIVYPLTKKEEALVKFSFGDRIHKFYEPLELNLYFNDGYISDSIVNLVYTADKSVSKTSSPWIRTADVGSLEVSFNILASSDDTISQGQFNIPLKGDWKWNVTCTISPSNPRFGCWGCAGDASFPLNYLYQETVTDSVFFVWGGNGISYTIFY